MAAKLGHTIVPVRPALVPLETAGDFAPKLQGLSLRNVSVSLLVDGERVSQVLGEMLFTHFGLSGPIILTLSRRAVDALRADRRVEISIDLKPGLSEEELDARLLRDLDSQGKRRLHNILQGLLPSRLVPLCLQSAHIPDDKRGAHITADERQRLRRWLKDLRLGISGHRGFRQAVITAGGVDTAEVDPRSMRSRLVQGLYFAGEILDIDADTGGYNLQAAFSTGWLAGVSAGGRPLTDR
jgi:predicted Rossmann fold flavoprotein